MSVFIKTSTTSAAPIVYSSNVCCMERTTNILEDALELSPGFVYFYYLSGPDSYTGNLPSTMSGAAYGKAIVMTRTESRTVMLFSDRTTKMAINVYNGIVWTGWQDALGNDYD